MPNRTKRIVFLSLLVSLSLILSYIESTLPPLYPNVPGVKIGFANVIVLIALYLFSHREAFVISLVRVFISALMFGSGVSLIYSLCGAVISLVVMVIFKKTRLFSVVGVSITGAVFHNFGQIIAAVIILENVYVGYYMASLFITGTIAGILTGLAGAGAMEILERINLKH